MSRDDLRIALEGIGWRLKSEMNGHHFQMEDHEGNVSKVRLFSDHALIRDHEAKANFYYKDCEVEKLDDNCVSLYAKNNKSVFINFYGEVPSIQEGEDKI